MNFRKKETLLGFLWREEGEEDTALGVLGGGLRLPIFWRERNKHLSEHLHVSNAHQP